MAAIFFCMSGKRSVLYVSEEDENGHGFQSSVYCEESLCQK